jgi:hypothetical protein
MEGFNKDTRLTKVVTWANAALIIPYLLSAVYSILRSIADAGFREYHASSSSGFIITYVLFIVFYVILIFGLVKIHKWSKWLIIVDSIAGLLLIFTFGIMGAYVLGAHPGQYVYLSIFRLSEYINSKNLIWFVFALKAFINTFNIFFFFGNPIFNLGKRYRLAHALWVVPALFLAGLPLYGAYEMTQFTNETFSSSADKIAKAEFAKITCDMVRDNNDHEVKYKIDGNDVTITYNYDFTGVWVTGPDGKKGSDGGPKYFCRPGYTNPQSKRN